MMPAPAYILDTHVLVWLAGEPEKLSAPARAAIEAAENAGQTLAVSAATIYEIAWLAGKGRLITPKGAEAFMERVLRQFKVLPISGAVALAAARIPAPFHGDPMDRLIVATAMDENIGLITADRSIRDARICKLVW